MEAIIINIGDELLIGQVINTNASWMSSRLEEHNIHVKRIITIADNKTEIEHSLTESIHQAQLVLITGGLGPTKDDITKHCLNTYFGGTLIRHEETYKHVEHYFTSRSLPFSEINHAQALVPDCCTVLMNNVGTAPCMWFEKDNCIIVSMPGVPFEMKWLMDNRVIPLLKETWKGSFILHRTILTCGIGESFLAETISDWEDNLPIGFKLAYLPEAGKVRLRLSAQGENEGQLELLMQTEIKKLMPLIENYAYGFDQDTLSGVIGRILTANKYTLSTAESCTGGCLAHRITETAGASAYFEGGVVCYSNNIKKHILGVPAEIIEQYGAVSQECVRAMAEGCRKQFNTDYAIATTGIAGPTGGTSEKPVGTVWIGIATPEQTISECYLFSTLRSQHQERTTNQALFNFWKTIR